MGRQPPQRGIDKPFMIHPSGAGHGVAVAVGGREGSGLGDFLPDFQMPTHVGVGVFGVDDEKTKEDGSGEDDFYGKHKRRSLHKGDSSPIVSEKQKILKWRRLFHNFHFLAILSVWRPRTLSEWAHMFPKELPTASPAAHVCETNDFMKECKRGAHTCSEISFATR